MPGLLTPLIALMIVGALIAIESRNLLSAIISVGSVGFLAAIAMSSQDEDPSNQLLDVETQLSWLRDIGFADVDWWGFVSRL